VTTAARTLLLATTSRDKIREIEAMLADAWPEGGVRIMTAGDFLDIEAPEETGSTFEENALLKAIYYARLTGLLTLADDSGLSIEALDGRPGVRSARYGPTSATRIERVLGELEGKKGDERRAEFVCVMALADPEGRTIAREGRVRGWIVEAPAGSGGFGYDPIFEPEIGGKRGGRTTAEMSPAEKNEISHRGRALRAILGEVKRSVEAGRVEEKDEG
jgi:XTP/dITP diphosphohydrolase